MSIDREDLVREVCKRIRELAPSCVTCMHFEETSEHCTLVKPPQRPPAKVIASGCPAYEYIPF